MLHVSFQLVDGTCLDPDKAFALLIVASLYPITLMIGSLTSEAVLLRPSCRSLEVETTPPDACHERFLAAGAAQTIFSLSCSTIKCTARDMFSQGSR
jgi:hypothetical protein